MIRFYCNLWRTMKYTILEEFKQYLIACGLRPNTITIYYNRMECLLVEQYFINDGKEVDLTRVINNMSNIIYKNHFSQCKSALYYFLKCFHLTLTNEQLTIMNEIGSKTLRKTRKRKQVEYKQVRGSIWRLKNKKLKLSYLVMMETGMRVFEISQIKKKDCIISKEKIQFSFIEKGGMIETACIEKADNTTMYDTLKCIINYLQNENEKLFYSTKYLQSNAKKYGFTCHDLRRIYAKKEYKKTASKISVMEKLRHDKVKTTLLYLNSSIKMD